MNKEKSIKKDLYYTSDYEWIDFQGTVAYVGICAFKLIGIKEIQKIIFNEPLGFKKKDEVIATIYYNDYRIKVHMPVDGKILQINEIVSSSQKNIILQEPEANGWIALIVPVRPYDRDGLLLPKQYQMDGKSKYAK
jgi:glycine cleavage system H protein